MPQSGWQHASQGPGQAANACGHTESVRIGEYEREQVPQHPVAGPPPHTKLNFRPGMVNQMLIVHVRRTGRHAAEAGEACIEMVHSFSARLISRFQHFLDQINPTARARSFVSGYEIGRASRQTEAAVNTIAKRLIAGLEIAVLELSV